MSKDEESGVLRPDIAAMLARLGGVSTTSRAERERTEAGMHFVGFDNATLLLREDNPGVRMYTNGIIGCNAVVLGSSEGTYMAHVNVRILRETPVPKMKLHTYRTIDAYEEAIGEKPKFGYIITSDGIVHPGIEEAIEAREITNRILRDSQFGIIVGRPYGRRNINSTFNRFNPLCVKNNLLPERLQWGRIPRLERGYMAPTAASRAREEAIVEETIEKEKAARVRADKIREVFSVRPTVPISEKHYMAPTVSSKARVAATRDEFANLAKDKGR